MPNSPFRIGRVVGGYAAVAAAWILVSDFLVHWLWPGLAEAEVASITKGLFFVAATSALLYYFLHR